QGTTYGEPSRVVLREVERTAGHVVLELETGGFVALPGEDGHVRLRIPGFESGSRPGEPSLPMRRALVEAVAGRKVTLSSVTTTDEVPFPGLRPEAEGKRGIEVGEEGTVLGSEERAFEGPAFAGAFPSAAAALRGSVFLHETKRAEVVFFPLRWDGTALVLSRRVRVRLEFEGRDARETSLGGSRGRRPVEPKSHAQGGVVAQLVVKERGLYRVDYDDVFPPGRSARVPATSLRLSRQGEAAPFHLTGPAFRPGTSLYFL